MSKHSIINQRAKNAGKTLLGILLDQKPTEEQEQACAGLTTWKGISYLPSGYRSVRMSLCGRKLQLAIVSNEQIREAHGLWAGCLLYDLAVLHFFPWRKRVPSAESPDSYFNFNRADVQALLDENGGENDFALQLGYLEDALVTAKDIPSREEVIASKADALAGIRDRSGEERNTVRNMLASIETKRAEDNKTLNLSLLHLDQGAVQLRADVAQVRTTLGEMAKRQDEQGRSLAKLEGLLNALYLVVKQLTSFPRLRADRTAIGAPPVILEAPGWPVAPGPQCEGWRGVAAEFGAEKPFQVASGLARDVFGSDDDPAS